MRVFPKYIVLFVSFFFSSAVSFSQVLAKAIVDKNKILIGEHIQLTLDVRVPLGEDIKWFSLDTIPHFDFIQKGKIDTVQTVDGKTFQQTLTITSFDSGSWQIPALALEAGKKTYYTDTVSIEIAYAPFNPADEYRDIKDIVEVENPFNRNILWFIAAGVVILLALAFYLWRRQRPGSATKAPSFTLSPHEEAMRALNELQKQGWLQNGQVKNYYSRLNDILRVFLMRKLSLASLQKTNDELILQLQLANISKEDFTRLIQALRITDSVKFAKYNPSSSENADNFNTIKSSIDLLNQTTT